MIRSPPSQEQTLNLGTKNMNIRKLKKNLEAIGYELRRQSSGSHEMWVHNSTGTTLTISRSLGEQGAKLALKQAQKLIDRAQVAA